jgi:hypothetical protein
MFVRFRNTKFRMQLSLIATRRIAGKVRHEHIGSLGSVPIQFDAYDRLEFWQKLHDRLQRLGNRIGMESLGAIMSAIHDRVPMVTAEEQRQLKLASAEEGGRFAQSLHDMHAGIVADNKGLVSTAQAVVADGEAEIAKLANEAAAAKQTAEKLRRGEDTPGKINRPITQEDIMKAIGWTAADVRHAAVLAEIERLGLTKGAIQARHAKKREHAFFRKFLQDKLRGAS